MLCLPLITNITLTKNDFKLIDELKPFKTSVQMPKKSQNGN